MATRPQSNPEPEFLSFEELMALKGTAAFDEEVARQRKALARWQAAHPEEYPDWHDVEHAH